MGSKIEVPVFTRTNLGTSLVASVPSDITAGDFKRELETVHFKCFPGSGEIEVYGLKVKKRSCFYYLPNSIPLKCAFHGVRGTWFLRAEARTSCERFGPYLLDSLSKDLDRILSNDVTDPLEPESSVISIDKSNTIGEEKKYGKRESQNHKPPIEERTIPVRVSKEKRKRETKNFILDYKDDGNEKKRVCAGANPLSLAANKNSDYGPSVTKVEPRYQQPSREMTDATGVMFSEVKSVTSIIKRYFPSSSPSSSDVTSKRNRQRRKRSKTKRDDSALSIQDDFFPKLASRQRPSNLLPRRLPISPSQGTSKGKIEVDVGKRLVVASDNLGISSSKKIPPAYLCTSRDGKLLDFNSSSLIKKGIFEISDSDD